MIRPAIALIRRDLGLSLTRGGGPLLAIGFYLTLMAMIPLSLGPDQAILSRIAAGLTWLCLALSSLLSLERLFERDYEDGVFDVLRLGRAPLRFDPFPLGQGRRGHKESPLLYELATPALKNRAGLCDARQG